MGLAHLDIEAALGQDTDILPEEVGDDESLAAGPAQAGVKHLRVKKHPDTLLLSGVGSCRYFEGGRNSCFVMNDSTNHMAISFVGTKIRSRPNHYLVKKNLVGKQKLAYYLPVSLAILWKESFGRI